MKLKIVVTEGMDKGEVILDEIDISHCILLLSQIRLVADQINKYSEHYPPTAHALAYLIAEFEKMVIHKDNDNEAYKRLLEYISRAGGVPQRYLRAK